ncbi:uncharacterized protein BDV17DRAFT_296241 [Aspergillus undulatus]|uniref:uncharacterized protein n=1 Tax=Aspergillus undulatus TaxID=1810928 RepID=UPI003CCDA337
MPQIVVVGAGFYGLVAAKTYLQVTEPYNNTTTTTTKDKDNSESDSSKDENDLVGDVLIIDFASDIGGTWAEERLYPNLLSQNSYGQYEFSDISLKEAVPDDPAGEKEPLPAPRLVVVYGGAKSAFDFIHLFGLLHHNSESLNLETRPTDPMQVHWIIREEGHGPEMMTRPTAQLGTKTVPSDQAVCTRRRIIETMGTCVNKIPKRVVWPSGCSIPRLEGSWGRRLLHRNPLGRALIRQLWKGVDADIADFAKHGSHPNLESSVQRQEDTTFHLADGTVIEADLAVHAIGWKSSYPILFDPPELGAQLGLPCLSESNASRAWEPLGQSVDFRLRYDLDPSLFKNEMPRIQNTYRLFRCLTSPSLVAEGDRSFAVLRAVYIGAGGVCYDIEDGPVADCEAMYESVANDAVWSRLTGIGLNIETLMYNDQLLRDLGLDPYREGGWWRKELMAVYGPRSYAKIVEEWMALRGGKIRRS